MMSQCFAAVAELLFYTGYTTFLLRFAGPYEYQKLQNAILYATYWILGIETTEGYIHFEDVFEAMFGCMTISVLLTPVIKLFLTLFVKCSVREAISSGVREGMLLPKDVFAALNFISQCAMGRLGRRERFLQFCQGMQISMAWFMMYGYFSYSAFNIFIFPFRFCLWLNRSAVARPGFWEDVPVSLFWTFVLTQFNLVCNNVCFHRYFAHNSFSASRPMTFVLAILGSLGGQRGALWWGSIHREHHKHCDTHEDIHSPYFGGVLWAHAGWLLDRHSYTIPRQNVQHLASHYELWIYEPVSQIAAGTFQSYCGLILGLSSPYVVMAWSLSLHLEFCINSLCHMYTSPKAECTPRDITWLGLVNAGEGYHRGHHERPWCARHGWRYPWWVPDLSYMCICAFERLSLVGNVQHPGRPDTRRVRDPTKNGVPTDKRDVLTI